MLFKKFFILISLLLFCSNSFANTPRSTGKSKNWESFTAETDEGKICFAQTLPTRRAPAAVKREKSKLFVGCLGLEIKDDKYTLEEIKEFFEKNKQFMIDNSSKRNGGWITLSTRILKQIEIKE